MNIARLFEVDAIPVVFKGKLDEKTIEAINIFYILVKLT
jgi:hypothetical protein